MNSEPIAQQILKYVFAPEYRPSKPKAIHKALRLEEEAYPDLRRAIKRLVRAGQIQFGANHLVFRPSRPASPAPDQDLRESPEHERSPFLESEPTGLSESFVVSDSIDTPEANRPQRKKRLSVSEDTVGIFRIAPNRQFGFVKLPRIAGEAALDEVFIPPRDTKGAMDGDTVRIRVAPSGPDKTEGKVIEIVSRGRREFTGTFQTIENQAMVWLDGANLSHAVNIGDVRGLPVNNNDKIIIELVRYPDFFQPGEAVILRVLGSNSNPAVDTMAVMHQFNLVEEFPAEAIEVARQQADTFNEEVIPEGRSDLTSIPTLTIDPIDARDFDDAISLSKNEKGNWELQVHIADVSFFVPAGSALDVEAQRRATSVYLPDRVIPMIPESISNHLA
ncbi:MAG: RNB domain-containing ribonuclease, partial [Pirellula sp.]